MGIDFFPILVDFGAKLGSKIEAKAIKNGSEKIMENRLPIGRPIGPFC